MTQDEVLRGNEAFKAALEDYCIHHDCNSYVLNAFSSGWIAARRYFDKAPEASVSIAMIIKWLRQRPGVSWQATIDDINRAMTALNGLNAHRDQIEALANPVVESEGERK